MQIKFSKYQGTGNDFILLNNLSGSYDALSVDDIKLLCNRRFGIGADGLILLQSHENADFYMQYFNSDGRESSMCGNGGRCIAQFAKDLSIVNETASFFAIDGEHTANYENGLVSLQMMNINQVENRENHVFILNTGSPHFVQFFEGFQDNMFWTPDFSRGVIQPPKFAHGVFLAVFPT